MHYDVIIIGAGFSGLAAGIRLAYFDRRVCIVEKHYAYGGLNSYYTLDGRPYDVGLHALTNYAPRGARRAPLTKLLRQLRIEWDELQLCPQRFSEIRFPGRTLRFDNNPDTIASEVARVFPDEIDRFQQFIATVRSFDDTRLDAEYQSTRQVLAEYFRDPVLIDMLRCPVMFYGSASEHDMDFAPFVTLFKSIFLEGFARPLGGVRTLVSLLVKKFRGLGGALRMQCGVERVVTDSDLVTRLELANGEHLTADVVLSSAGFHETMQLCGHGDQGVNRNDRGQISFVESMAVLDRPVAELGHDATIVFYVDRDEFAYEKPEGFVDTRSGILCCPGNYEGHDGMKEGLMRLTWLANYDCWSTLDEESYRGEKDHYYESALDKLEQFAPNARRHLIARDMFTPRTIHQYTGHFNGAVYGAPHKIRDGRTLWRNLFLCGTDQGYLGIIGVMLSGIMMANLHVLSDA